MSLISSLPWLSPEGSCPPVATSPREPIENHFALRVSPIYMQFLFFLFKLLARTALIGPLARPPFFRVPPVGTYHGETRVTHKSLHKEAEIHLTFIACMR